MISLQGIRASADLHNGAWDDGVATAVVITAAVCLDWLEDAGNSRRSCAAACGRHVCGLLFT